MFHFAVEYDGGGEEDCDAWEGDADKVGRDMFIGYFLVFLSYAIVGCMGYIGFMGTYFKSYFLSVEDTETAG